MAIRNAWAIMAAMLDSLLRPRPDSIACCHAKAGKRYYGMLFNLVWMLWIFADLIFGGSVNEDWYIATAASIPLFLALYVLGCTRSQRYIGRFALAMTLLGYAVLPWNHSGGVTYIIYGCVYFAFFGTPRQSLTSMLVAVAGFVLWSQHLDWPWAATIGMSMVALSVGGGNLGYRINAQKDAELRLSHDEVRRLAATAERERIGRDLHDLLGHTLSLITLKSELANKLFDRDAVAARREMIDVEHVARDALAQVRRAVTGIRAAGFAAELASAKLLLESNGVHLDYELADVALPVEVETALAMTVREAVTNIQRHARASRTNVTLAAAGDRLALRIVDDGRGGDIVPGNGLSGMRERLTAIGAELRVESQRGHGTRIEVTLSLPQVGALPAADMRMRQA
ncbi:MAG: sensor histidine kinase [Rudaea sp.]